VPRVVTDIPPVHSLVAQVMGTLGDPVLLLDKGANAHSFQLRPSQAAALADADLVVWIGPEMTPWLDGALGSLSPDTAQLALLATEGTLLRSFGKGSGHDHAEESGHDHDHAEETGHDHDHAEETGHDHDQAEETGHDDDHGEEDGHDHSGTDPHAWLEPANAQLWLGVIAAELSRIDPENAGSYRANAERSSADIAALDTKLAEALAPVSDRPFVVFHDAYGYFVDHYGLDLAGSVAMGDAAAPGAAHLAALQEKLGTEVCIFPEPQHDPRLAERLASDTGARLGAPLDPEGAGLDPGPQLYGKLLSDLAGTLVDCLSTP
jgi:zinc transport system substrate-binding protein